MKGFAGAIHHWHCALMNHECMRADIMETLKISNHCQVKSIVFKKLKRICKTFLRDICKKTKQRICL